MSDTPPTGTPVDTAAATGGCLCGAVRYRVAAPVDAIVMCHCTHCQKASGTGASANVIVPTAALTVERGTPRVFSQVVDSGNTLERHFCGDCGSPLWSRRAHQPERTVLKVGSLDAPEGRVVMNIWTRSARAWTPMADAPRQFPQGTPG